MSNEKSQDELVAELTEIARRFSDISQDEGLFDEERQDSITREQIYCWVAALTSITVDLRVQRSAPREVWAMLTDLASELVNLYNGAPASLRDLRRKAKAPPLSVQRRSNQALVAIIIDNMREAGSSPEEAARHVVQELEKIEVSVLPVRSHSESDEWERLVDLRKKVKNRYPPGHPVRDTYDMFTLTLKQWPPSERISRAWANIR